MWFDIVQSVLQQNGKLLSWKYVTFNSLTTNFAAPTRYHGSEQLQLLITSRQQLIHSHILDVIVQNTSAVSTTQLIPGAGIN